MGIFDQYYYPTLFGVIGFTAVCVTNALARKPALVGIHRHIIFSGMGIAGGISANKAMADSYAERDAIMSHYMSLHPTDFEEAERRKYADVLEAWVPCR